MYDEWASLLSALVAAFFGTALLVFCVGKKKAACQRQSPAPANSTKSPAPVEGMPTPNYCVRPDYKGKPDVKEPTKTISEVEPEDAKSIETMDIEGKKEGAFNFAISEAQTNFAVKLLRHVYQENKSASAIMSPASIAITLAMVYAGAKAETKTQLAKLIANGASDEEIHKHFSSLVEELSAEHAEYTLEAANSVYAQQGFTVHDAFKADIKRYYRGLFKQVDFKNGAKAAKDINDFVKEKTQQKIDDLVSPEALNELTGLVLVNAIHLRATWKNEFSEANTEKKAFYVSEGNEAKVDTMHLTSGFIHFDDDDAQVLGLPYEGDDLFMFVILPRERYGLQNVLRSLNGKKLAEYLGKRAWCDVNVQLPRFKVETSLALKEALTTLGLTDAFILGTANFQGIAKEDTYIHAVLHKAFVETDEYGTEAVAAVGGGAYGCDNPELKKPPPREFVADHPFLYVITNRSGTVMFFGYVLKP